MQGEESRLGHAHLQRAAQDRALVADAEEAGLADADFRLHLLGVQGDPHGGGVVVAEGAAQRGDGRRALGREGRQAEVVGIYGRHSLHIADPRQDVLGRREGDASALAPDADGRGHAERAVIRQTAAGRLEYHGQRQCAARRTRQCHPQAPVGGIEAPGGQQRPRHRGHGHAGGRGQRELARLALHDREAYERLHLDDPGAQAREAGHIGIDHGGLHPRIARARFPGYLNPVGGRQGRLHACRAVGALDRGSRQKESPPPCRWWESSARGG